MKEKILELRNQGKKYKEICAELNLSKSTVSYHIGERKGRLAKKDCKYCGKEVNHSQTYCSKECNAKWIEERRKKFLENGQLSTNKTIRVALIERDGDICKLCSTSSMWNGKPLTLHVDHIDGNSDNNGPDNLRLLCPNCHSQLETSKGTPFVKKETRRNKYLRTYKGYAPVV